MHRGVESCTAGIVVQFNGVFVRDKKLERV